MAHQSSFSGSQSSHSCTPGSTPGVACGVTPMTTATFSIFQEGPGKPLVFAPPTGTPELQSLVDLFIALDIPVSMKMEMIQRDFETHTQRTNERYKTYVVPAAPITTSNFTSSPSPIFHNAFEPAYQSGSMSGNSGSGSGSSNYFLETAPVSGPSPIDTDLNDSLLSLPLFPASAPAPQFTGDYQASAMAGYGLSSTAPTWISTAPVSAPSLATASWPSSHRQHPQRPWQRQHHRPSRLPNNSMQIVTRDGEDVTHMSSRSTRTREERENTRIVRQRGACADCRRKKTRCDPGHHMGSSSSSSRSITSSTSRVAPYAAPTQAGRAKEEAMAAQAAQAAHDKAEGKKPVTTTDSVIIASQTPIATSTESAMGTTTSVHDISTLGWDMLRDSFDWTRLSDQGRLFTDEELGLEIAASLTVDTALPSDSSPANSSTQATAASPAQASTYRTLPQSQSLLRLESSPQQSRRVVTFGTEDHFDDGLAGIPGVPISPSIPTDVPLESFATEGSHITPAGCLGAQPSLTGEVRSSIFSAVDMSEAAEYSAAGTEQTSMSRYEGVDLGESQASPIVERGVGTGQDGDKDGRDQHHGLGQLQPALTRGQLLQAQHGQAVGVNASGGSGSNPKLAIASSTSSLQASGGHNSVSTTGAYLVSSRTPSEGTRQPQIRKVDSSTEVRAESVTDDAAEYLDVGALYAGFAALVSSLLPSLLSWRKSQASDDSVLGTMRGIERLAVGPSLVICQ